MIVLRGIPLYGYKFAIDTDSRGCYVEILDEAGNSKWGGGSPSYVSPSNVYSGPGAGQTLDAYMEQKIKDIIDEEVDGDYIQEKLKNKKGIIDLKGKIIEANRFSGDTVHANQNMDIGTGQDTSVATQGWVKSQGYSTGGSSSSDPATPTS